MDIEKLAKFCEIQNEIENHLSNAHKVLNNECTIKDSGERRIFETGAVRDMAEGKGRFDIMPLDILAEISVDKFIEEISKERYFGACEVAIYDFWQDYYDAFLDLAKHFENGLLKYGQDNWKKGIPKESYIDSALRHYCKAKAGWKDEPHATACLWNLVCLIWTLKNKTEEKNNCSKCVYFGNNPKSEWYLKCCLDKCAFKEGRKNEQNI